MKNLILFAFLILYCSISFSQESQPTTIKGVIKQPTQDVIQIAYKNVRLSEKGEFMFTQDLEFPALLDVTYAGKEWTIFIEPNNNIHLTIQNDKDFAIEYTGDLAPCNTYLLTVDSVSKMVNSFLNRNWISMHSKNQADYISIIDSLKNVYLKHLDNYLTNSSLNSDIFRRVWKAEIDYGFNTLIVKYPIRHFQLIKKKTELNPQSIDYLKSIKIEAPEYFNLQSYKRYTKTYIDYQVEQLAELDSSIKHYNLKKIESVFHFVPETFSTSYLRDFWLCEFLKEHIDKNRLANSKKYIDQFNQICKNEQFANDIEKLATSISNAQEDHEVMIYKTENDFKLEAHVFKPDSLLSDEKRPGIVIFHGGGWNGGNPSWAFGRAKHFKKLGMVAIAVQYRLTNEHDITALESMADARDLIKWIRLNSDSLNIRPNKVAAYGWSAGAHLVSSSAIFCDSISDKSNISMPNAMILLSPAVSLPKGEGWEIWKLNVFGAETTVSSANPVEHVHKGLPPTIILQGRDDTVTPLEGVQLFHNKMLTNENYSELWVYDGVGHLFTPSTMPDNRQPHPDKEIQKKAFERIDKFLTKFGYIDE